jgi:hypothetical protein
MTTRFEGARVVPCATAELIELKRQKKIRQTKDKTQRACCFKSFCELAEQYPGLFQASRPSRISQVICLKVDE